MPMLTANQVHVDAPLTNLTIAYMQSMDNFIATKVFPTVNVSKKTDKFYVYDRAEWNRTGNVKDLAPRTRPERVGMSVSQDSYSINVRGLATDFDAETLANEDTALNTRAAGVNMLTSQLMIDRDKRWVSSYFVPGVWTTDWTGVAATPTATQVIHWDDYTTSTPIVDVTNILRTVHLTSGGFRPNVMVVTRDVRDILVNHPDILARLNGGATVDNPALVTDAKLAEIFGVAEFHIIDTIQNDTNEGAAESLSYLATKEVAFYYKPEAAGLMVPSAGYTFVWDELDRASGFGVTVKSYSGDYWRSQGIEEEVHSILAYDHKVIGADLGAFIDGVIS